MKSKIHPVERKRSDETTDQYSAVRRSSSLGEIDRFHASRNGEGIKSTSLLFSPTEVTVKFTNKAVELPRPLRRRSSSVDQVNMVFNGVGRPLKSAMKPPPIPNRKDSGNPAPISQNSIRNASSSIRADPILAITSDASTMTKNYDDQSRRGSGESWKSSSSVPSRKGSESENSKALHESIKSSITITIPENEGVLSNKFSSNSIRKNSGGSAIVTDRDSSIGYAQGSALSKRKRTTSASILPTTTTTTQISNMSIFKPDPRNATSPTSVTVVAEHYISHSRSPSQDFTFDYREEQMGHDRRPSSIRAASIRGGHGVDNGSGGGAHIRKLTISRTEDIPNIKSKDIRDSSGTLNQNQDLLNNGDISSPKKAQSILTESRWWRTFVQTPQRWFSLRNILAITNTIVIAIAVSIITIISYYSGLESARAAVLVSAQSTLSQIQYQLDLLISDAETVNVNTMSWFSVWSLQLNVTALALQNLYFGIGKGNQNPAINQVYTADPNGRYAGVIKSFDILERVINTSYTFKWVNESTKPNRLSVDFYCDPANTSCFRTILSLPPSSSDYYDVSQRPYWKAALSAGKSTWTSIYTFATNSALGITAVNPIYPFQSVPSSLAITPLAVAAVDISLSSLSSFLQSMVLTQTGDSAYNISAFIFEINSGYLVATSNPSILLVQNNSRTGVQTRVTANASNDELICSSTIAITRAYPSLTSTISPLSSNFNSITLNLNDDIILAARYNSRPEISWLLVVRFPSEMVNQELGDAYSHRIPIAAGAVLVVSILCSFCLTRTLAKPLKRAAERLNEIADLNFESEEMLNRSHSVVELSEETLTKSQDFSSILEKGLSSIHRLRKKKSQNFHIHSKLHLKEITAINDAMSTLTSGLKSFAKYVPLDVVSLLVKMKREAVLGVDEQILSVKFQIKILDFVFINLFVTMFSK